MSSEQPDTEKADLQRLSRRETLGIAGTIFTGGLAGCSSSSTGSGSGTPTPGVTAQSSPFTTISFEAKDMVVGLDEAYTVQRVNLIAPDGTLYTQANVAAGASTVRLQILDLDPGVSRYEHYDPGVYELAAVTEGETRSQEIDLQPDLTVTDVEPYVYEGSRGYLAVTLENKGTAPTWPYQITYQDTPYSTATESLNDLRGFPQFLDTDEKGDAIVAPGETGTFVSGSQPLVFGEDSDISCTGTTIEFSVLVGQAVDKPLERQIRATVAGEKSTNETLQRHSCTEITADLQNGGQANE